MTSSSIWLMQPLNEMWVEMLMSEQIEALKKIWEYDDSFLGNTYIGCYIEPQP